MAIYHSRTAGKCALNIHGAVFINTATSLALGRAGGGPVTVQEQRGGEAMFLTARAGSGIAAVLAFQYFQSQV